MPELPGLSTKELGSNYLAFDEVDSTNDYLKRNMADLPHGTAVTATLQTAGKGRLGKSWSEQKGSGLALSVLLHNQNMRVMSLLPLLCGLAVCDALKTMCGVDPGLKWSNDVVYNSQKLCGILCESRLLGKAGSVVLGIGINLNQSRADFDRLGLVYATSLYEVTGEFFAISRTAAAVLTSLEPILQCYNQQGFEPTLRGAYLARCVNIGKPVRIVRYDTQAEEIGTAIDIGPDGSLICNIAGETRSLYSGDVSVRGIYGYSPE